MNNHAFCILPWIHMYIDPTGESYPCCVRNPLGPSLGSVKSNSVEEIWNGSAMRTFRRDLLDGVPQPQTCDNCYAREAKEGTSHRLEFLREFKSRMPEVLEQTHSDGSVSSMRWALLDFRLSNVCNFKCRTCGPEYSSSIAAEYESIGWQVNANVLSAGERRHLFEFYLKAVNSLERIYFAGGEPLLVKEHYELLEALSVRNRLSVELSYNTNLSRLQYAGKHVTDYWQKFKDVKVWPSIDHFGVKAEYIRKGTAWSEIVGNLKTVRERAPHVVIRPNITVSLFNVLDLPEILEQFAAEGWFSINGPMPFSLNVVREPAHYSVSAMPTELRLRAQKNIERAMQRLPFDNPTRLAFRPVLDELLMEPAPGLWGKFLQATRHTDKIRGENFFTLFPEFSDWNQGNV